MTDHDAATDLTSAVQAARADIEGNLPSIRYAFTACWDMLYVDRARGRRGPTEQPCGECGHPTNEHAPHCERDDCGCAEATEPSRSRCGACEHREDEHTPHCEREGCRCRKVVSWPSTVGWAQWTGPGVAEMAYTAATKELQRAHDCIGAVNDVPAHWASDVLCRPGHRSAPMELRSVLYGVRLLGGALGYIPDDLAPPEASALLEAADHVTACRKALERAQDRLSDGQERELAVKRCNAPWCREAVHTDGLCQQHHAEHTSPRRCAAHHPQGRYAGPCAHCGKGAPEKDRTWCAACRRGHAKDRLSCTHCKAEEAEAS